jgi:predicted nuclease of predicted toxin-antitoxin system
VRVLLDHNLPRELRQLLPPHDVWTTRYKGWDRLNNGLLLRAAADDGFDLLLTLDKGMEYEQNLSRLPIPIVQMDAGSTSIDHIRPFLPATLALLTKPLAPALYIVAADGTVTRVTAPRPTP